MLTHIRHAIEADEFIIAAWLSGSRGRGTADDLSDIDIWLVVEDSAIGEINADPLVFVHAIAPTIMHIPAPSIAPPGGAFVLTWIPVDEGFTQVDWYWTPASTASRPAQTKLLFEHRPIPVDVPVSDRLSDDALTDAVDDSTKDALLLIAYAWKHARRGDVWKMMNSFRLIDGVLSRLDWLIDHGREPAFNDPTRSFLPGTIPIYLADQRIVLQKLLNTLISLIRKAGCEAALRKAIAALRSSLSA